MEEKKTQKAHNYYEDKRDLGKAGREASRLFFMRTFNNWIKSALIQEYSKYDQSVLDLCCGKGGDLDKWRLSKAGHYVGLDIANHAINHAKWRYEKYTINKIFPAIFIIADAADDQSLIDNLLPMNIRFNVVSSQMSFHYLWGSEHNVRNFFLNVTSRLEPGGYFIGTVPDANILVKKLRHQSLIEENLTIEGKTYDKVYTFGNNFYKCAFTQKTFSKTDTFGIKYYFYLEDAVGKKDLDGNVIYIPEYLIIFKELERIAAEYGLYLVEKCNFHDFYQKNIKINKYAKLFGKIVKDLDNATLIEEQWDATYIYTIFAFQKEGGPNAALGNCGNLERLKIIDPKQWN